MALLCNDVRMEGRKPICLRTGEPCAHLRYCAVSRKYYQTDNAARCRLREQELKR